MQRSKKFIKRCLGKLLGQGRTQSWIDKAKGRSRSFSEADLIWRYFQKSKPRGVMVDVGAHFGESFERYLDQGWDVIAFEPDPKNREILEKRHSSSRLHVCTMAVSDKEKAGVFLFTSDESSGISSLSAFRPTHQIGATVDIVTLSSFLANTDYSGVNFLKIDTEGHDLFALRGFPWDREAPEVILCEFEDRKTVALGYTYRDLGGFLIKQGYRVLLSEWKPIETYGAKHEWIRLCDYPCDLLDSDAWGNLIAYRSAEFRDVASQFVREFGNPL